MGGIFGGKKAKTPEIQPPNHQFSDTDTTKEVGAPLTAIYGRAHVFGNIFHRKLSNERKNIEQGVSLCWGPVHIDLHSIRINEKLPQYVNGVLNPAIDAWRVDRAWVAGDYSNLVPYTYRYYNGVWYRTNSSPEITIGANYLINIPPSEAPLNWTPIETWEYIPDTYVWTHSGALGQTPDHGLEYGLNRTAYLWITATASDQLSSISKVECDVERGRLFTSLIPDYNTPLPTGISSTWTGGIRSSNPIAAALDWLLNKDYGAGRDPACIQDFSTFTSCMAHCDNLLFYASGGVEHRWSVGVEAGKTKGDTHSETIEKLLANAFAQFFESSGMLKCWMLRNVSPVPVNLNLSNFQPDGASTADISEIPNLIEVEYRSNNSGNDKRKVIWQDPDRINDWREVTETSEMLGIPTRTQAARTARMIGRRALSQRLSLEGEAYQSFMTLEPGDLIPVTVGSQDSLWFSNKLFWVDEIVPDNKDGDVELTLTEYAGTDLFDDLMMNTLEVNDPLMDVDPTTRLPDPGSVPLPPADITGFAGSVVRRPTRLFFIDLSWTEPAQPIYMHTEIVIHRRTSLDDPWVAIQSIAGSATSYRDMDVEPVNTGYYYWIASRTSANRMSAGPANAFDVYVPPLALDPPFQPQNITVVTRADSRREILWSYPNVPGDFEGFVATANPGDKYEPSFAKALHDGVLTATKCTTLEISAAGKWCIAIRAKDTFGNFSEPAVLIYDTPAPPNPDRFAIQRFQGAYRLEIGWNGTSPINFAGMKIRINQTGDITWANAAPLFPSTVQGNVIPIPVLPQGQLAILGKAVDTFGNEAEDHVPIFLESQGSVLSNVVEAIDHKALGFPGTKTGATIGPGGDLEAGSATLMFTSNDERPIYSADPDLMYTGVYGEMVYEATFVAPLSGVIYLDQTIQGNYTIELIKPKVFSMYEADGDLMYPNAAAPMYLGEPSTYESWPGYAEAQQNEEYGFRIRVAGGTVQGAISQLVAKIDVPDLEETIEDIAIAAGGTRIPITKNFTSIKGVSVTLQYQVGTTALTSMILDKDVGLGPLIQCFDKDRNPVSGFVDVTVKGY